MSGRHETLFLDIGNTRTDIYWQGQYGRLTDKQGAAVFQGVVVEPEQVKRVVAVSVAAPAYQARLQGLLPTADWVEINAPDAALMASEYAPDNLGLDRWLAALAVARQSAGRGDHVVVDLGTASTLDLVARGVHKGGWILPGLDVWQESLLGRTTIPAHAAGHPDEKPGTATPAAIASGWLAATVGAVERMCARSRTPRVWVSGGNAGALESAFPEAEFRTNLVLEGLVLWAQITGRVS